MTKLRRAAVGVGATIVALFLARAACLSASKIPTPAHVVVPADPIVQEGALTRLGANWMRKRGRHWRGYRRSNASW